MSSPKPGPCSSCGSIQETRTVTRLGKKVHSPVTHNAPCGLPCRGGGSKAKEAHGVMYCSVCGFRPKE